MNCRSLWVSEGFFSYGFVGRFLCFFKWFTLVLQTFGNFWHTALCQAEVESVNPFDLYKTTRFCMKDSLY